VSRVQYASQHVTGDLGQESFQAVKFIDTVNFNSFL